MAVTTLRRHLIANNFFLPISIILLLHCFWAHGLQAQQLASWGTARAWGAESSRFSVALNSGLATEAYETNIPSSKALTFPDSDDRGSSLYQLRYSRDSKFDGVEYNNSNPWKSVVPHSPPLWTIRPAGTRGVDVTIEWNIEEDTKKVSELLIEKCIQQLPEITTREAYNLRDSQSIQRLSWSLSSFRDFVSQELMLSSSTTMRRNSNPLRFKARMAVTRGSPGTKCPQWHIDHVPVRWIESFVGRGCEVVTRNEGVNWNAVNGLDDEGVANSVNDRNRLLVDSKLATIHQAVEGEALLLVGNRWNEFAKDTVDRFDEVEPAVHKSPSPIPFWEGRVLLTQDVILD